MFKIKLQLYSPVNPEKGQDGSAEEVQQKFWLVMSASFAKL